MWWPRLSCHPEELDVSSATVKVIVTSSNVTVQMIVSSDPSIEEDCPDEGAPVASCSCDDDDEDVDDDDEALLVEALAELELITEEEDEVEESGDPAPHVPPSNSPASISTSLQTRPSAPPCIHSGSSR
jgi:hypothetical protein